MSVIYKPEGESRGVMFFGVGHGGVDAGAVGYLREETINLKQAMYGMKYAVAEGFTVVMSRNKDENDSLTEEIREANASGASCAIDWHNNAGGGDGFEIYYSVLSSAKGGKLLAQYIEKEVEAIGQNSRGSKTRKNSSGTDYYGFIRQTKMTAVIAEGCFVDNKKDVKLFDTEAELKAYGEAVAKGAIRWMEATGKAKKVSKPKKEAAKPAAKPATKKDTSFKVKIVDDALNIREGAGVDNKKVGTITNHGVYTIVKTKKVDGVLWGKLKSGAGWICLHKDYVERV